MPPGELNDNLNRLPGEYLQIRLQGKMRDAGGREHPVDEHFADLAEWRQALGDARQRYVDANTERRLASELDKKFGARLDALSRGLEGLSAAVTATGGPTRPSAES